MIRKIERRVEELRGLVMQLQDVRRKPPSEAMLVVETELREKALTAARSLKRDAQILKFAVSSAKTVLLLPLTIFEWARHLQDSFGFSRRSADGPPEQLVAPLLALRWLYTKPNREHLELIASDLTKDIRKMRDEGRSELFVRRVVSCRMAGALLDVSWDGLKRLSGALLFIASVFQRLRKLE